ncbi:hypothetical protein EA462_12450 [Natrarchaeobius halalkaliphilus]|uniref:DUF8159 domain-containing protein n=1 Tax=Natrarchaeobius halalkaliphilus TaxID=1679091 RepID=A0A3N6M241_9EURY|nr:hypothetical protein [Natrarchaeobius halalkaliphilus]RQG89171.1 hypothetical protein EA462_12450 [Natrarchaeobius halalkaliphilus]
MNRRVFGRTVAVGIGSVIAGGCLGGGADGGSTSDPDSAQTDDDAASSSDEGSPADDGRESAQALEAGFDSRGLDVLESEVDGSDRIVMTIQTSGNLDEDIRIAGGAYATEAQQIERDLTVRTEDRGLHQETFTIERDWAVRVATDRMSDEEYLERIEETRTNN